MTARATKRWSGVQDPPNHVSPRVATCRRIGWRTRSPLLWWTYCGRSGLVELNHLAINRAKFASGIFLDPCELIAVAAPCLWNNSLPISDWLLPNLEPKFPYGLLIWAYVETYAPQICATALLLTAQSEPAFQLIRMRCLVDQHGQMLQQLKENRDGGGLFCWTALSTEQDLDFWAIR